MVSKKSITPSGLGLIQIWCGVMETQAMAGSGAERLGIIQTEEGTLGAQTCFGFRFCGCPACCLMILRAPHPKVLIYECKASNQGKGRCRGSVWGMPKNQLGSLKRILHCPSSCHRPFFANVALMPLLLSRCTVASQSWKDARACRVHSTWEVGCMRGGWGRTWLAAVEDAVGHHFLRVLHVIHAALVTGLVDAKDGSSGNACVDVG